MVTTPRKKYNDNDLLKGMSEIAEYLKVSKNTAYRWQREYGMPVFTMPGGKRCTWVGVLKTWLTKGSDPPVKWHYPTELSVEEWTDKFIKAKMARTIHEEIVRGIELILLLYIFDRITREEAQSAIGVSKKGFYHLLKRYKEKGINGIVKGHFFDIPYRGRTNGMKTEKPLIKSTFHH